MKIFRNLFLAFVVSTMFASCASLPQTDSASSVVGAGTFVSQDGQSIRAVYYRNNTVTLTFFDGTTKVLTQAASGSGTRYVSGEYEWWEHQGEARYSVGDKQVFVGKAK